MLNELIWFNNYMENIAIENKNVNEYLNKLSNKTEEKNVENKINQIEKDYLNKLKEIELLCENENEINKIKNNSSLVIIQKEYDIIKLLTKYTLQNKNLNYKFFSSCLLILLNLSEILRIRLGQKEINTEKMNFNENGISRCSYKFCSYQDNCSYNYNSKIKNICYQDHYVHNMVSLDLKILLNYIKKQEKENTIYHNKEILKTINTLSFVIGHMESELKTKCLYVSENEKELCHYIKNK